MTVKTNRNSRKKQKLENQKETTSVENRTYRNDFFVGEANELFGNFPFNIPVHISGFRSMKNRDKSSDVRKNSCALHCIL